MPLFRHLCQILTCASFATGFATAHVDVSMPLPTVPEPVRIEMTEVQPPSYMDQLLSLPLFRFFTPSFAPSILQSPLVSAEESLTQVQGCPVDPLPHIEDEEALALETASGPLGAVDLNGLTPSTAVALARFQRVVTAAGGAISITSAYRPASYQEHLRAVWEKWMLEMRTNTDPLCLDLRTQVREEFEKHTLLESQRPVVASDHTRGLSFDASIRLPGKIARKGGRKFRISIDALARRAGVIRPDIRRDPVHFRLRNVT